MRRITTLIRCSCLVALVSACSAADVAAPSLESSAPSTTLSSDSGAWQHDLPLKYRLEKASRGLLYTSESDYPFTYLHGSTPDDGEINEAAVRDMFGVSDEEPVETVSLDHFFARHIELVDPADSVSVSQIPRYVKLKRTLRESLPDLQVYRVGTVEIRCYIIGTDVQGHVAGLETISIET